MNETIIGFIVALVIIILLFFAFRELNIWYWKINERIAIQHKTNFLLEKISIQLGDNEIDEITVEEIETGKLKKVKLDDWIEFKTKKPNAKGYRTVKSDTSN